jgi:hypothetical protein
MVPVHIMSIIGPVRRMATQKRRLVVPWGRWGRERGGWWW